jgi:O-antigen ligase
VVISPLIAVRLSESVRDAYDERAGLMRIALRVIEAHPLTGVGPGAYEERYKNYLAHGDTDQWLAMVHNEYLLRAAETGIPGGLAWLALLVLGLRQAMRVGRKGPRFLQTLGIGWSAALVALMWEMYWDAWRGFSYNGLVWFMLGLTEAAERLQDEAVVAQGTGSSESRIGGDGGDGPPPPNSSEPMSQRAPWGRV